jgi:hypothetical protein
MNESPELEGSLHSYHGYPLVQGDLEGRGRPWSGSTPYWGSTIQRPPLWEAYVGQYGKPCSEEWLLVPRIRQTQ